MINFYLNSDKLKAISATASAKKIRVNRIYDLDFPNEFLSEPDADKLNVKLTEAMLNIIRAGDIKTHSAGFVIDDSKISFREMILPQGKPLQLAPIIKSELFNDPRQAERNTVDYVEIERDINEDHQNRVMVTYLENSIIDNIKKCGKDVSINITSLDIQQNALSKLVWFMRDMLPENFMLVDYHITYATTYLFLKHKHEFSMTKSIFSVPSEGFANETAFFINDFSVQISDALSFFMSRYEGVHFDTVYLTGSTFLQEPCISHIAGLLNTNIQILPKPDSVEGVALHEFNDFSGLIGSLIRR